MRNITRPAILLTAALAATVAAIVWAQREPGPGDLKVSAVRGSVHLLEASPAGNVGASAGPDGVFIIDDQFEPMAPAIVEAAGKLSKQPIRYVLNTHWHRDHTGGNAALGRQGYVIVAHDNVRERLSRDSFNSFFNRTIPASPGEALPVITFSENMTFHFNGDTIRVVHIPNAHTDGDAVFFFEKANVLHAGDVFVRYGFPFIDLSSGGSVAGMIAGCERIMEIADADTLIIPGHGEVARERDVATFRDMLITARDRVQALKQQGMSDDAIVAAKPLADLEPAWGKGFINAERFVRVLAAGG
ncbi:MAG: MBL fold metallo-hydrolase [Gammaproteobacteria bacterium]|nr:MBL fold metallo-hydrolase [Gammaproteobacteria bacterium]